jgi:hypothetical protein
MIILPNTTHFERTIGYRTSLQERFLTQDTHLEND